MALVAAAGLSACSSGTAAEAPTTTTVASPPTKSAPTTAPTTPATTAVPASTAPPTTAVPASTIPPTPAITGYGATLAEWKATHARDKDYLGLPAYGPSVQTPGGPTPQYVGVQDDGQRIIEFIESLPEGTSLAEAQTDTLAQLPSNTAPGALDISNQNGSCDFWNLDSPTLAAVGAGGNNGEVVVEMAYDDANGEPTYKPSDINTITIEVGQNDSTGTC